ncbi:MAG: hypothetical protein JST30_13225 [Armatimonadetes bacterium]|nr:hypothetical protein [Armatimonadota bacterium]
MNHEHDIDRGFAALRDERPEPESALKALKKLRSPAPRRNWTVVGVPIAVVAAGALFLAVPRTSAANELKSVLQALRQAKVWMATVYVLDPSGREVVSQRIASDGRVHKKVLNRSAPGMDARSETAFFTVGNRRFNVFDDCTLIDKKGPSMEAAPEQIVEDMLTAGLVKDVRVERSVIDRGARLDKYTMTWDQVATGGRHGTIAIFTEPGTKRPVRMVGLSGNSVGFHSEWIYDKVPAEMLDATVPSDRPCYDLTAQREDFSAKMKSTELRPGEVKVVGAWSDRDGYLLVMTCGDAGKPVLPSEPNIPWNRASSGGTWNSPTMAFGKPTVAHVRKVSGRLPDRIKIDLQVWTDPVGGHSRVIPVDIEPVKTFSVIALFTPLNVPFFETADSTTESPTLPAR